MSSYQVREQCYSLRQWLALATNIVNSASQGKVITNSRWLYHGLLHPKFGVMGDDHVTNSLQVPD